MDIMVPEIDEIVNFYTPETLERIARETGFVERESKFGGTEFLGIMTVGLFSKPDASLTQMAAMAKDINPESEISAPGLHQRINGSGVEYLKRLLSEALELSASKEIDESIPELLRSFRRVCLIDSTGTTLPENLRDVWRGSGGDGPSSAMKLQLMLDYKKGEYVNVATTDGVTPDQSYIKEATKLLGKDDLAIFDLGYFNKEALFDISQVGGYFLSRLNHQVSLYKEVDGELRKFHLAKELKRKARKGVRFWELEVWLTKGNSRLKVRLIAEGVPDGVASKRRRKVRQKARRNGYEPSAEYLYLLGWSLYITTISKEVLKAELVSLVYGIRWQIELVFKAWKSYHGLSELKGRRLERVECFIYGRLIMMTIMAFLFGSVRRHLWTMKKREPSFFGTIDHFQLKAGKTLCSIANPLAFYRLLEYEFHEVCRLCVMDSRKRLSTAQKVRMVKAA